MIDWVRTRWASFLKERRKRREIARELAKPEGERNKVVAAQDLLQELFRPTEETRSEHNQPIRIVPVVFPIRKSRSWSRGSEESLSWRGQ